MKCRKNASKDSPKKRKLIRTTSQCLKKREQTETQLNTFKRVKTKQKKKKKKKKKEKEKKKREKKKKITLQSLLRYQFESWQDSFDSLTV